MQKAVRLVFLGLGAAIGRDLDMEEGIPVRLEILRNIPPLRVERCARTFQIRDSIVVSISACHAEDPGSIPGRGVLSICFLTLRAGWNLLIT